MNTAKKLTLGLLRSSGAANTSASFTVTTTGAQTLTINSLTVSAATTVDWGDGSSDSYTGGGARTHDYAGVGTWTVRILEPLNVTALDFRDTKAAFAVGTLSKMLNLTSLILLTSTGFLVGAGEVRQLTKLTLLIWGAPNMALGVGEIAGLTNLTYLDIAANSNVVYQTGFENLTKLTTLKYQNSLTQTQVDSLLLAVNTAGAARIGTGGVMTIASGNAAPSGTYALECPVTTGNGAKHNLLNNGCGTINAGRVWTTINTTP